MEIFKEGITITAIVCTFFVFFMGIGLGLAIYVNKNSCYGRWGNSSLHVKWSLWGDCQVQLKDGRWVPENLVRYNHLVGD